jgi:hypothetical protein
MGSARFMAQVDPNATFKKRRHDGTDGGDLS